jgi:hypothetical protein
VLQSKLLSGGSGACLGHNSTSKNIFYTYSAMQEDVGVTWPTLLKGTIFDEFDIE